MNKKIQSLVEPGARMYLFFLFVFAATSLFFEQYTLAAMQAVAIIILVVYSLVIGRRRKKELIEYIESVTYEAGTAKDNTLMNFPLPMLVFSVNDGRIVWANSMFFDITGSVGSKLDTKLTDLVPDFNGKWLLEGKSKYPKILQIADRKYQVHGNVIRPSDDGPALSRGYMGVTYWLDVTDYDNIRAEYSNSRSVVATVVIDNYDELTKNQPERTKNDLRDSIEDMLHHWADGKNGILRRYERDKYLFIFEQRWLQSMREQKFPLVDKVHSIVNPQGIQATLSIGVGAEGVSFAENLQFSSLALEMALSRGGDQTVVKNRLNFEIFGGRGNEVEKRTKVKSRVMANAVAELVKDSTKIYAMGHKFADMDSVGACVAACSIARKFGKPYKIVIDLDKNVSKHLISKMREDEDYRNAFISPQEALMQADAKTLLFIVDTNNPEQVEDENLLVACNRVVVVDHHRRAASYIDKADLTLHEPSASSACELMSEVMQEIMEISDIKRSEADAVLAGIVLDTKNFTIRTGERSFDAAAFLRRAGAETVEVKKMLQNDMRDTVTKYKVMQTAKLYRDSIAIALQDEPLDRVVAAQVADELLNISSVETSFVIYAAAGGVNISARAIGNLNVQIIMENLGGGGNSNAAAVRIENIDLREAVNSLFSAIDAYLDDDKKDEE